MRVSGFPRGIISGAFAASLAAAALCASAAAPPQASSTPTSYRLASLKFNGLSRLTEAQLETVTGLKSGGKVTTDDLLAVQKRLSKSGAFDEVAYNFKTLGSDLSVIYDLTESTNLAPCVFDNFIWFSSDEIEKALRDQVPLYAGAVPARGAMLDDAIAALQTLARTKAPAAKVDFTPFSRAGATSTSAIIFHISGVPMPLQSVTFVGATAIPEKDLEAAMSEAFGQDFSATRLNEIASKGLTPLFHNKGYLRVKFGQVTPMLGAASGSGASDSFPVGAAISIDEGAQYNWDKATWTGNHQFQTDELDRAVRMEPHEVANEYKIEAGLNGIRMNYLTHGYSDSNIQTAMLFDEKAHLVTYLVTIEEGPQYHMGTVQFLGVPARAADALAKKWTLKPGDVFNPTYSQSFITLTASGVLAGQGLRLTRASTRQQTDKQAHTVNLTIVFQ